MHTAIIKIFSINIIAAISWLPPLISQLFSPRRLRAALFFYGLAVFEWISLLFVFSKTKSCTFLLGYDFQAVVSQVLLAYSTYYDDYDDYYDYDWCESVILICSQTAWGAKLSEYYKYTTD